LAALLIVAAVFGYQQWQLYQQLRDLEETDAAILSSDLPMTPTWTGDSRIG
jgi:hypothetical protein